MRHVPVMRASLLALLALMLSVAPVAAAAWAHQSITTTGLDAYAPSIAYGPGGRLHLTYIRPFGTDRGLHYATNSSGSWKSVKIAGLSSSGNEAWTSLAIDDRGNAHVAYQRLNKGVLYITNRSGSWTRKVIRSSGNFVVYPEIAVDAKRKAHIVYFVPSSSKPGLRYSTNRSGEWVTKRITTSAFDNRADIALDSAARAHVIVGRADYGYRYLTNKSGSWTSEKIRDGLRIVPSPSITLDGSDRPHVSFGVADGRSETWRGLRTAGGWQLSRLSDYSVATSSQIAVATSGKIHLVTRGTIHWSDESGAWWSTLAASDPAGWATHKTAFALGPGGVLAIAYPRTDGSMGVSTRGAWDGSL